MTKQFHGLVNIWNGVAALFGLFSAIFFSVSHPTLGLVCAGIAVSFGLVALHFELDERFGRRFRFVAPICGLCSWITLFIINPSEPAQQTTTLDGAIRDTLQTNGYRPPTPESIYNDMKSRPAMTVHDNMEEYAGFKVVWDLNVWILIPLEDSTIIVVARPRDTGIPAIEFVVETPTDYPQLKLSKENDPITVHGTIQKTEGVTIFLDMEKLLFR